MTDIDRAVATSTDPEFVRRQLSTLKDGRNRRSEQSRRVLLAACRRAMVLGIFRPTMRDICAEARRSDRTGFQMFGTLEALHLEALEDEAIRWNIAGCVGGDELTDRSSATRDRIVRAIVTGRVP